MAYVCLNGIFSDLSPLSIHSMPGSGVKADLCEGYDCSVQILAIVFPVRPFTAIRSHLVPLGNHSCKLKCTFISRKISFHMQSRYYPFWHRLCSNLWINSITVLKWCIFTLLQRLQINPCSILRKDRRIMDICQIDASVWSINSHCSLNATWNQCCLPGR